MCDILNALDGTEDDKVYADDMPELPDYDMAMEKEIVEKTMTMTSFVNSPHKTAPLGATTWIKVYDQQQWFLCTNYW